MKMKILDSFYSLLKPNWVVLDLGAGEGKQARHMKELGVKVVAVDSKTPKEKDDSISWNILPIQEWVIQLNETDVFDAILARNIFQFFDKNMVEKELIPILSKHLKTGGILAIETFYDEPVPPFDRPFNSLWDEEELKKNFIGWEIISSGMEKEHTTDLSGSFRDFYKTGLLVKKS